ncbi:FeoA family protein [Anaerofustis stercorihominis]|uniref:FeoA domain protein n=2 Tax=Anaerofustis stercorihominis TaxID=214853 RepID=B1C806_9FIRM|nr:FeoA family protein [Anaerofustis stercorihominis]EDS73143.1 FeoA domain protein [Anaerofustis stercorihominis DSM 17244]MCQ4794453.1 ferrous iron transport protein A [Anaerofustis stercorihominis]RGD74274.1 ferrous iron transport protein A [Anaerofustis stercorihominis]
MEKRKVLSKVEIGNLGKVLDINCEGDDRRRFLDLGVVKGTKIKPVLISPLGDPRAYEIRGSIIAFRKEDADKIEVFEV